MITRHYLVRGQVQGVGYRRFIQKRAQSYGVAGWVRNLSDGRVEALVQGKSVHVEGLEVYLRRGPLSGRVEELEVREIPFGHLEDEFRILSDGEKVWQF